MEALFLIVAGLSTLVSFVCLIIVTIALAKEHGALWAILGFCLCSIGVFIWGWASWKSESKMLVMIIWTLAIVFGAAANIMVAPMLEDSSYSGY